MVVDVSRHKCQQAHQLRKADSSLIGGHKSVDHGNRLQVQF